MNPRWCKEKFGIYVLFGKDKVWWTRGSVKTSLVSLFFSKDEVWWTQVLVDPWFGVDEVAHFIIIATLEVGQNQGDGEKK